MPWSRDVASLVTGVGAEELTELLPLARALFRAAAESTTGRIPASAEQAAATLAARLRAIDSAGMSAWPTCRASWPSRTRCPCLLVNVWRLLWRQPAAAAALQEGQGARRIRRG